MGFTQSLAKESRNYNIKVNAICPLAYARITEKVLNLDSGKYFTAEHVSPFVGWLCHEECEDSGKIFEIAGGNPRQLRL